MSIIDKMKSATAVRLACIGIIAFSSAAQSHAAVAPFPIDFKSRIISTADGADIFVRWGGQGPVVILLHGFGDTGDMWAPLAGQLAKDHAVVVPDLRGMGLSSHPKSGFDKRTQAADIHAVLEALGYDHASVVGHDIGTM